ncbi:hypothetical protein HPB48_007156 [Haemaphysalis longicornis]|uniref:Uncharacterized protein n=1 Tax=Haemaphysalis longicornis TaxID=44386 RepID=A0A9J6FAT0_HAELO|nr:hypothetical protein HPB48_007156 [Haemaphysalis longicornis]
MRRRRVSTVEAYLTCSMPIHDDGITRRSLDQLFLCPACNKEEVPLTAANSEALYKLVLDGFRTPSARHGFVDAFEVVLRNGPRESCLPCLYGGLVDFPYGDLGLCTCSMRPLYVAIYYSNVHMMSLLLHSGAHVMRTEHICPYEEPHLMMQVRGQNSLACSIWIPALPIREETALGGLRAAPPDSPPRYANSRYGAARGHLLLTFSFALLLRHFPSSRNCCPAPHVHSHSAGCPGYG